MRLYLLLVYLCVFEVFYLFIYPSTTSLALRLCPDAPFVSRTGKTNDLTRIKGWMEKFSSKSAADSKNMNNKSSFIYLNSLFIILFYFLRQPFCIFLGHVG